MTAPVSIWWRDDDAVTATPALDRLLALKETWRVPLALAVVPAKADASLARRLEFADVDVLVHGYAHANHAAPEERKSEFPAQRDPSLTGLELRSGLVKLRTLFPAALPVFVPPWNRLDTSALHALPAHGYTGLSAWGPESQWPAIAGLSIANTHVDVIDWRNAGRAKTLDELKVAMTQAAARGTIGLLTHHLQMSAEGFAILDALFQAISRNPGFVWTPARHIFQTPL